MTDKPKTLQLKPRSTPAKPNALRAPVRPKGPARARPQSEVQAERAARVAAWAAGFDAADRRTRDERSFWDRYVARVRRGLELLAAPPTS